MDFARAQALALKLIDKNGRTVSIQKLSSTPVDSAKPWNGPAAPTVSATLSTKAVFLPHASTVDLGSLGVDDELLKRVEQVALIPGGATDLSDYSTVLDGGVRWKIDWIRTLKPADVVVLYVFGVKR